MSHFPAAVIFDMDGLLLDTERVAQACLRETAAALDLSLSDEALAGVIGRCSADSTKILQDALPGIDITHFRAAVDQRYVQYLEKEVPLKPHVKALLEWLAKCNIPRAVATSTRTVRARAKLEQAGILSCFSHLVGGDQTQRGKPAPDIYLRAAELLQVLPEECLVLEDSLAGVEGAVAAGMRVIMVPDLIAPTERARAIAWEVLPDLGTVRDRLLSAM